MYNHLASKLRNESARHGWGLILIARQQLYNIIIRKKPRTLLDIGCHNRLLEKTVKEWAKMNNFVVYTVGLDIVKYEKKPEVLASGDILPFRDSCFEFVTIIEALEHIPDYVCCLKECYRVLKENGGLFIQSISCISEDSYKGDETHFHVLHPETLSRLLNFLKFKVKEWGFIGTNFYIYAEK